MSDLPAGRELDVLVARVVGHTVCDRARAIELSNATKPTAGLRSQAWTPFDYWYTGDYYLEDSDAVSGLLPLPHYSTDIAAAWQVVERMGFAVAPTISLDCAIGKPDWWAGYPYFDDSIGREWTFDWQRFLGCFAETAPHAICLAALKAKVKE